MLARAAAAEVSREPTRRADTLRRSWQSSYTRRSQRRAKPITGGCSRLSGQPSALTSRSATSKTDSRRKTSSGAPGRVSARSHRRSGCARSPCKQTERRSARADPRGRAREARQPVSGGNWFKLDRWVAEVCEGRPNAAAMVLAIGRRARFEPGPVRTAHGDVVDLDIGEAVFGRAELSADLRNHGVASKINGRLPAEAPSGCHQDHQQRIGHNGALAQRKAKRRTAAIASRIPSSFASRIADNLASRIATSKNGKNERPRMVETRASSCRSLSVGHRVNAS